MLRYFIKLSYDGTNYHGWQSQNNAKTLQSEIEKALSVLLSQQTEITGAGRTDAGVHAKEYFAHFDCNISLNKDKLNDFIYRLNAILPSDIAVYSIFHVNKDVHARFSAVSRTYRYYISKNKEPFIKMYSWCIYENLNIELMNNAAAVLYDYTDFTSFSKLHTNVKNNNCKIIHASWHTENNMLIFTITADRFLRNMVRSIVGTLLDAGREKISINDFRNIIECKNRCDAGYSVPARGLFLEKIEYSRDIYIVN